MSPEAALPPDIVPVLLHCPLRELEQAGDVLAAEAAPYHVADLRLPGRQLQPWAAELSSKGGGQVVQVELQHLQVFLINRGLFLLELPQVTSKDLCK